MRTMALVIAASMFGGAALADTVVIKEGPVGPRTIVREAPATVIERREIDDTGSVNCETKSVTRTNELGETTRKTKTECED